MEVIDGREKKVVPTIISIPLPSLRRYEIPLTWLTEFGLVAPLLIKCPTVGQTKTLVAPRRSGVFLVRRRQDRDVGNCRSSGRTVIALQKIR